MWVWALLNVVFGMRSRTGQHICRALDALPGVLHHAAGRPAQGHSSAVKALQWSILMEKTSEC